MKHNWKITAILIFFFVISQLAGLYVVKNYIDQEKTQETGEVKFKELPLSIQRPEINKNASPFYILAAIIIGTALLFLLMKFEKSMLWKAWYLIAVALTLTIALGAFIPQTAAAIIASIAAIWKIWKPNPIIHNSTEALIYGGLAAIFVPIMNISAGITLLILISIYDIYAVWKSEHMIKLAKFQAKNNLFAGFFIPKDNIDMEKAEIKKEDSEAKKGAILGGGDIGMPLLFAGIILQRYGMTKALIIPTAATIALFLLLYISKKEKFYPAMPFISGGCIIGYLILLLI